ncbi:MAG: hypothetical protein LBJ20_07865 [Candidatus Methanoplasma sp.]|jgi:hypothetical protein|nr:hypothetical protein [Candidatus Methanoplasma sp.]
MNEVMEVASGFMKVCGEEIVRSMPRHTAIAIGSEIRLPMAYDELETNDVSYITGEGQRLVGEYQWNSCAGLNYLWGESDFAGTVQSILKIGDGISIIGTGSAVLLTGISVVSGVGFIVLVGLYVAGYVAGWYQTSAQDAIKEISLNYWPQERRYAIWRDTMLFGAVDTGFVIKSW